MIVLSHRGYWRDPAEKNRPVAFHRSFDLGFGTETDIRDIKGELVISHDAPTGGEITLAGLLDILSDRNLPMAMNIKADGLAAALNARMAERGLDRWFTFDMSIPETLVQLRQGLPVFTRVSEYEPTPAFYDKTSGIWLDAFESDWHSPSDINGFLQDGKKVCVVSPELHKRDHLPFWTRLKASAVTAHPNLMLCTDLPEDAAGFFGTSQ